MIDKRKDVLRKTEEDIVRISEDNMKRAVKKGYLVDPIIFGEFQRIIKGSFQNLVSGESGRKISNSILLNYSEADPSESEKGEPLSVLVGDGHKEAMKKIAADYMSLYERKKNENTDHNEFTKGEE